MNSIDERIRRELEAESLDLDKIIGDQGGLPQMLGAAMSGTMRTAVKLVLGFGFITFGVLIFCLIRFVGAETVSDQIFWAVWTVLTGVTMIGLEIWTWMEINRASTIQAIARVELAIRDKKATFSHD